MEGIVGVRLFPLFGLASDEMAGFLQSTVAECGLACIGAILCAHGQHVPLTELRNKHSISMTGMTLRRVRDIASEYRLNARAVKVELDELSCLRLPAILHWNMSHFVVLRSVSRKGVNVFDPSIGARQVSTAELNSCFTGVALELWPDDGFERREAKKAHSPLAITRMFSGLGGEVSRVLLFTFSIGAISLATPLQLQLLVDQALARNDRNLCLFILIGFGLLRIFGQIGVLLRSFATVRLSQYLAFNIQSNLIRRLISLPLTFFQTRHIGTLIAKFDSAHQVQEFLVRGAVSAAVDGVFAVVALILLFTYGPVLALACFSAIAAGQIVEISSLRYKTRIQTEKISAFALQNTNLVEMLSGIQALKLSGRSSEKIATWENAYSRYLMKESELSLANEAATAVQGIVRVVGDFLVLYLVTDSVFKSQLTIGMMVSFIAYSAYFSGALGSLIRLVLDFKMLSVPLNQLAEITLSEPESTAGLSSWKERGTIEFRDVWFRYDAGLPYTITNLSFSVAAGEYVAIKGRSGIGKTTILKLLLGVMKPERGEIHFDGIALDQFNLDAFRSRVGVVMQDDQLFTGSIIENVTMFDEQPDLELAHWAMSQSGTMADVARMPMGENSLVGDMGSSLSGGQKQRLFLARALYKKPTVLLMDEATSHLDDDGERLVCERLRALKITRLAIAHRAETLRSADRVIELK